MVVGIVFLASLLLVLLACRAPTTREQAVVQISYDMTGEFTHTAFGPDPNAPGEDFKAEYFATLVQGIDVSYRYQFAAADGASFADVEQVEISAVIESPGIWEKEVVLVPRTEYLGGVDLTFPLDLGVLQRLAAQISQDLGVGNPSPHIILKADVQVRVPTSSGVLLDRFTQTLQVSDLSTPLAWTAALAFPKKGYYQGLVSA